MKVKVARDTSTIIYHMASSHCVIVRERSDKIGCYSLVMLYQVAVHQDPKFQSCPSKVECATSLYPRNSKPGAKQLKVFELGTFKPHWVVLVGLVLNTFEGTEW